MIFFQFCSYANYIGNLHTKKVIVGSIVFLIGDEQTVYIFDIDTFDFSELRGGKEGCPKMTAVYPYA